MTGKDDQSSIGRTAALCMIGLGGGVSCSVGFVQARWPELAACPLLAGSGLALIGVAMLLRCKLRAARAPECIRIPPYVPEMADGSDGTEILKAVLTSVPQPVHMRPEIHRPAAASAVPADRPAPFFAAGPRRSARTTRRSNASATLISALRLGSEWSGDLHLSGRALARLESDPFVQRLARLG